MIISEIEEINLADYMRTLEAPVFDEEAALADAFFGFGAGAFLRGKETASDANGVSSRSANTAFAGGTDSDSESSRGADTTAVSAVSSPAGAPNEPAPASSAAAAAPPDADGGGAFAPRPERAAPKPETPGRAGRRGWSRQGSRGGQGAGPGAEPAGAAAERPQTGGLDDADCAPGGLDGDAPMDADGEFAEINADIYDDSDDDSWGRRRAHTRRGCRTTATAAALWEPTRMALGKKTPTPRRLRGAGRTTPRRRFRHDRLVREGRGRGRVRTR